nr:MAG TPA: Terminase large subunit [Caudoviricetes sp.]
MKKNINTRKYIEEYVKIRNKNSKIISLKFNEPQLKYYNTIKELKKQSKPVRIIILKARQMGFSTATEGIFFKETVTKPNVNTAIVAHKEDSTTNLFNMSKLMYDELPEPMKPEKRKSNAKELVFDKEDGSGLKSKIKCFTAGGKGVGRSDTINNLHLSELAFWQGDKKATLTGLLQAVPNSPDTMIVIESTANGYEYFKELWDDAVAGKNDFVPIFIGWNELQEYQMPYTGFELTKEEQELQRKYGLTLEQLSWRRWCIANNCGNDIEQFKQEYPINPEEAFISTGKCYFDKINIIKRIQELKDIKPLKQGFFSYDYDNLKISNIKWIDDKEGPIKIYREVEKGYPYVLSGDTAGEGSDYFTGHVLDNVTGKQVAVLKLETDEITYTRQMYCLGIYYNTALIGIESNYTTYPIQELIRLGYTKQFIRVKEDKYTHKHEQSFGFKTTLITRPLILAELQKIVKELIELIVDIETLREMLVFIKNEKGRPEAQLGYHDDLVMALAIAYYIRNQQTMKVKEEAKTKINTLYKDFGIKEKSDTDYGSTIEVI